jgi:AraC family transcriptional regulator, regulatory protein of adaptative response / methylated-DNA-[protein]-cysteine methyltransferase
MSAVAIASRPSPAVFRTDDDRWNAVIGHNAAADGAFYYSVASTGVYCRPSCAARRPRRDNVRFHLTRADAETAGFRPCKRCRPDEPPLAVRHAAAVAKACRLIEDADEMPSLDVLAAAAGLSRFHFHRVFHAITGLTPRAYTAAHRAGRVRAALRRSATVTDAIYAGGFNSNGRFYATSSKVLGMTPGDFRAGGAGTSIRFAVGECSLGSILVAATDKGVCAILLGSDPDALTRDLQDRFPNAMLTGDDAVFQRWVAKVIGLVEAPQLGLDLPLDVRGTAFQQRVWRALSEIPAGSTVSYAEIAQKIGAPHAARAVARACAANPLAIAIPCHRVVRSDGDVSGYRWGVARKRELLKREASTTTS